MTELENKTINEAVEKFRSLMEAQLERAKRIKKQRSVIKSESI